MTTIPLGRLLIHVYMVVFLAYMLCRWSSWAARRSTIRAFPRSIRGSGLTDRWFVELWNDERMWTSFRNTMLVALAVVAISHADRHGGGDPDQQPAVARRARCSTA